MTPISRYLVALGIDPFLAGLAGGALIVALVLLLRRAAGGKADAFHAESPAAPPAPDAGRPITVNKSVHFRMKINGQDHALNDAQTAEVLAAIKAGDFDRAAAIVREGLDASPETAKAIVDALKKTHLA